MMTMHLEDAATRPRRCIVLMYKFTSEHHDLNDALNGHRLFLSTSSLYKFLPATPMFVRRKSVAWVQK